MTEDEMARWHHQLNGHEFEQALGVGEGQGSLVCCNSWGCKESDMTEQQQQYSHEPIVPEQSQNKVAYFCFPDRVVWLHFSQVMQFLKLILNLQHLCNFRFVFEVGPLIFYVA